MKTNKRRHTPIHIVIKFVKYQDEEKVSKAARKKKLLNYKWSLTRRARVFKMEIFQAIRQWYDILKVLNGKKSIAKNTLCSIEGEIKRFPEKQKLKELMTTKPVLQQIVKGTL